VFAAGRFDAEHYQEKYYAMRSALQDVGAEGFVRMEDLLVSLTNGHTPLHHDLSVGDVPFLCAEHVTDFEVHYDTDKRILQEHHIGELNRTALVEGDVLLTIKGRVGNAGLVENPPAAVNINQDVALLRLNDRLPLWYLLAFLNSPPGKLASERMTTGAINPFLGLANVRNLEIPVFPDALMHQIGDQVRGRIHAAHAARRRARALLERAKRAVEIAIEDSEATALRYLAEPVKD
jgi:hypothetical protein